MGQLIVLLEVTTQLKNMETYMNRYKYCETCKMERDRTKGEWQEVGLGEAHRPAARQRICTKCQEDLDTQQPPF